MDHDLKQRVVGAIVITALAAIFVPMLFDDPVQEGGRFSNELKIPEPPSKPFSRTSDRLPESTEQVLNIPDAPVLNFQEQANNEKTSSGLERWIIQVGSFSQRENALQLQDKLRKNGFSTFLDAVDKDGNGKLFRLRVGPELNKDRAESIKKQLEKNYQLKAILVSE